MTQSLRTTRDMLEAEADVRDALGCGFGESIAQAAARIMAAPHGDTAWRVAAAIVHGEAREQRRHEERRDHWRPIMAAAKCARRWHKRYVRIDRAEYVDLGGARP